MSVFSKFGSSRFARYGLPLVVFLVGGSFVLSQLTDVRYKVHKHRNYLGVSDEDLKVYKRNRKTVVDEYEDMKQNLDIDNWENIRGPRPWEEDEQKYKDIIDKRIKEAEEKKIIKGSFWAS